MSKSHEIHKQPDRHLSPLRHDSRFKGLPRNWGWKVKSAIWSQGVSCAHHGDIEWTEEVEPFRQSQCIEGFQQSATRAQ